MGRRKQRTPQKVAEEDSGGESQSADPPRTHQTNTGRRRRQTKRGNTSGREGHPTLLSQQEAPTHTKKGEDPKQSLAFTNNEPDDCLDSGTEADSEDNGEDAMYAYFGGVVYPAAWNAHWPPSQVGRRIPVGQDVRVKQEPRGTDDWKYGQYTAHVSSYPIPSSNMVRDMPRLQYNMLPGGVSVMACQAEPPKTDPPRPWSLALTATANRMALHDSNPSSQQTNRVSLGWGFPTNLPHTAMYMYRNNLTSAGSASEGNKESATHRVSPLRIQEVTDENLSNCSLDNGQKGCSGNASPITNCKDGSTAVVHIPPFAGAGQFQPVPIKEETEDTCHEDVMEEETPLDLSQSSSLNGSQNIEVGDGNETYGGETERAGLSPHVFSQKMHTKYSYHETDEGEKVFNCPECNKVIKNHVARHLKTHTGEKKYQCHLCPYSTARKDNLQQHMATRYHREVLGESPTSYSDMLKKYSFLMNTADRREFEEAVDEAGGEKDNMSRTYAAEPVAMEVELSSEDAETGNRQSREQETKPGDQSATGNLVHSSNEVSGASTEARIGTLQQLRSFLLGQSSTVKTEEDSEHQTEEHRQEENTTATSDSIQPYKTHVKDAAKVPGNNNEPTTLTVNKVTTFSSLNFPNFTMETSDTSGTSSPEDGSSSSTSEETTEFLKAAEAFALCKSEEGGLPVFRCTLCNKSFPRKQSWNRHMKLHVGNRKYKCELCSYSAKAKRTLEQHMAVHKLKPSNPIELMKFISPKQGSAEADQLQADPASIVDVVEENGTSAKHYHFQCQVCQFVSSSSLKFSGHMHLYHEREQWKFQVQCNFCRSTSKTEEDIKQHLFKNHGIRQKPLDRFTLAQEVMSEPELFSCTLCNFVTKMKAKFEAHLLVHYTAKMYQCKKCHKYFKTPQELSEHLATMHVDTRHNCDKCSYGTNLMSALKAHMLTHGKEEFKCRICRHTTDTKLGLKMHVSQQHRYGNLYRCNTCGYLGKTANKLIDHIRTHTKEKPFSCKLCKYACSRQDNLAIHMRVHKKDTVYDCPKCDFLTLSVAEIEAHHKTHTWSRSATKVAVKHMKYVFTDKKEPNMQMNNVEPEKKQPMLVQNTSHDTDNNEEPIKVQNISYDTDKKEPTLVQNISYDTDKKDTTLVQNIRYDMDKKEPIKVQNTSYDTEKKEPMPNKNAIYVDTDKEEPNMEMKHTSYVETDTDRKEPMHIEEVETETEVESATAQPVQQPC